MSAFDMTAGQPAPVPVPGAPLEAKPYRAIAVIGGGAWGTALSVVASRAGRHTNLWARRRDVVDDINQNRRNSRYLGDVPMPERLTATDDFHAACAGAEAVLLVTPSGTVREMAERLNTVLAPKVPVVVCAKGIEDGTGFLMADVVADAAPGRPVGALSGPSFADETARGDPTAVTVASEFHLDRYADLTSEHQARAEQLAARMAVSLTTESFRPYVSNDLTGVEVGGAVKNVLAIACGMATGAGFAANTRAALITRGLDEMKALAEALGGRRETVTGLSGIGDLTLTCSNTSSRNFSYGVEMGEGRRGDEVFGGQKKVVEGVRNSIAATALARRKGVEMPICETVRAIVHDGQPLGEAFAALWSRPLEAEPQALKLTLDHPSDDAAIQRFADAWEE
ncbi:MAG: NAD(P)H-dependent glycerol-3-phosphate dehydrogenase [Pseudomonadota bacterium]